jgi:hypothetical protein
MADTARLFGILDDLIDRWCERRALQPLALILAGYPPAPELTDGWATLYATVRNLKGLAPDALSDEERTAVSEAHALIYQELKESPAGLGIITAAG